MALSGYVTSGTAGSGGQSYFRVDWTATQDVATNKSTISWTLKLYCGTNYWYTNAVRIDYVKINGTTVKGSETYSNKIAQTYTLASGSLDVAHNSDGTKSFKIEISGWFYEYGTRTGEKTFTLDTIPRASTMSVPTFTAGTAGTFSITRASSSFTHTIQYKFGNIGWTSIVTKTSNTSVSWTSPLSLLQQMTNTTSKTETNGLWLATYSGDTLIGEKYYNLTIQAGSSAKPTASLTVSPDNSTQNSTVQGWGYYIKGLSKINYSIGFTGYQGSTVSAREFVGNGQTLTTASGTTNLIGSSGTLSLKARVKDSRGRWSDYATQSITVYNYSQPVASSTQAYRTNSTGTEPLEDGTYIMIDCTAQVGATINNRNTLSVTFRIVDQSTGSVVKTGNVNHASGNRYTNVLSLGSGGGFEVTKSYLVTVIYTDTVGNSITRIVTVPTADVTLHLKEGGKGVAFGGYATVDDAVDFTAWSPIGRILGLGRARSFLASGDDLNGFVISGVYGILTNSIAGSLVNGPSTYAGTLRVWNANGQDRGPTDTYHYVMQEYVDLTANIYIRSGGSGSTPGVYTWDSWKKITMTTV